MSFFDGLLSVAAPLLGFAVGGPAGAALGAGLGAAGSYMGQQSTNEASTDLAYQQMGFNSAQSAEQRAWATAEAAEQRSFNSAEAAAASDRNAWSAQAQRNWQGYMSDTQWQRGVKDMQAAGLNPMLAYSQGGNTAGSGAASSAGAASSGIPSGSTASSGALPHYQSPAGAAINTAGALASVEKVKADARLTNAEAAIREEDVPYAKRTSEEKFRNVVNEADIKAWQAKTIHILNSETYSPAGKPSMSVQRFKEETDRIIEQAREAKSYAARQDVLRQLDRMDMPRGMAYEDFYKTEAGKKTPWLDPINKIIHGAGEAARLRR